MYWLPLILWLWAAPATAAVLATAQSAAPTSDTQTQNLTRGSFGTPTCALFAVGMGLANGTTVDHHMLAVGAYDGTNQASIGFADRDAQTTSDAVSVVDTTSGIITVDPVTQVRDGDPTIAWMTDGAQITWTDAPPSAYLVNALLLGGGVVSNCYQGMLTTNATQNGTVATTAPGFTPDVVIVWSQNNNTTNATISYGAAVNDGSRTQRAVGFHAQGGVTTTQVASILRDNRVHTAPSAVASASELTSFDANGFTLTTRDASGARQLQYLAIKLSGINVWLGTTTAPLGPGSQAVASVGFKPVGGLQVWTENTAVNTVNDSDNGEVFSLTFFDGTGQYSAAVTSDDGVATSNAASVTANTLCHTSKGGVDHLICTLTSLDNDGLTRNFSTVSGAANLGFLLLFQDVSGDASLRMLRRRNQ